MTVALHKGATCIEGDQGQYCKEDCAPFTCYGGICAGHEVYPIDGTCGYNPQKGTLQFCTGKWGKCCDLTINARLGRGTATRATAPLPSASGSPRPRALE
ncbi:hypothetical protein jhhlp_005409 [Lomentospora prolificans]|uniref:Uncharacterized protein n=1 Tax=Lomentospora prolificans TaxID=41688 RepID=A0A2N3N6U6_9PEZI|nr:hypothetical protein jhhlp_005409 [Lomentospora prolificans]